MSEPAEEFRSVIRNTLKESDGRAFMAFVLSLHGYHTIDAEEGAFALIQLLDEADHKGVINMIQENFLKGER